MKEDEIFVWKDEMGWKKMKLLYGRMKWDEILEKLFLLMEIIGKKWNTIENDEKYRKMTKNDEEY